MEGEKTGNIYTGLDFWDLLSVALIVLRLCGVISLSWVLILLPKLVGAFIDFCIATFLLYIVKKMRGDR